MQDLTKPIDSPETLVGVVLCRWKVLGQRWISNEYNGLRLSVDTKNKEYSLFRFEFDPRDKSHVRRMLTTVVHKLMKEQGFTINNSLDVKDA